ncbi:periplasmic [NiFeSe] hydrogenase large subunit [Clostridium acetireducens DSM 10703]|uniref:Periplasmic [NiFeSe] hydrogenase large subunit n=1 Tax=Clostridium acetireducens DSM 10703 TaxID=1121290 RepID=A0A1E8F1Q3_9CLOT|nr:nickel-dependent hydrogenase large subunit [Clostridium acetireducens]OFI07116.1 periplasmic [NiFeSe] hydrogenase large subunit [Clostridium acetireducens DSM 10703]
MTKIVIDPVTRVSGFLEIEVQLEKNEIVDAKCSGMQFRGFEKMFQGRPPLDAVRLTERICGICSTHHSVASALALENALNVFVDENDKMVRDIVNGLEFLQNHLRQVYLFTMPDFVRLPDINPIHKDIPSDFRLPKRINDRISQNYMKSTTYSRDAHKALAILAGKAPHNHGVFVGGITTNMNIGSLQPVKVIVDSIRNFIEGELMEDIYTIAGFYNDYFNIGKGYKNFMSYGLYDTYKSSELTYCKPGILVDGKFYNLDMNKITQDTTYAWFEPDGKIRVPGDEPPTPNPYKKDAYSWVYAPRYEGKVMSVGPLARMILSGNYENKTSTMDRIIARVLEAEKICKIVQCLLESVKLQPANQKQYEVPERALGVGAIDASRGGLAHWISIENKLIKNYTVITPTAWNLSPADEKGLKGEAEKALIGTHIEDIKNPVEIGRIIRSYDPCLTCAAHIVSDRHAPIKIRVV